MSKKALTEGSVRGIIKGNQKPLQTHQPSPTAPPPSGNPKPDSASPASTPTPKK